jgi:hypothetical protein
MSALRHNGRMLAAGTQYGEEIAAMFYIALAVQL